MESIKLFNGLNGTVVSREDLQEVIAIAKNEEQSHVVRKLEKVLNQNDDESFKIEILSPATPTVPQSMLNGLQLDDVNEFDLDGLNKPVSTNEIYQMVTDKIIEALEQPLTNWEREWGDDIEGYALAYNFVSKKLYRSVNQIILNPRLLSQKYPILKNPYFLTFKQVSDLGGKVKKDSKGQVVTYYSFLYSCVFADINVDFRTYDRERFVEFVVSNNILARLGMDLPLGAFIEQSKTAFLKYYKIFNGVDIEGIDFDLDNFDLPGKLEPIVNHHEPIDICEQIIANYPAPKPMFTFGGASAHFAPAKDVINMPNLSQFNYAQAYYTTYFHEMIHSTGVKTRLDRDLSGQMKTKNKDLYAKYAFEELIAEIGAMFLCSQSGILHYTLKNSLAYVKSWRQNLLIILKEDNKFVFRAATQSQKAVDFLAEDFQFIKAQKVVEKTKEAAKKQPKKAIKSKKQPITEAKPKPSNINLEKNPKGFAIKPKSVAVANAIKEVLSLPRFKGTKPLIANLLFNKFRKVDDFEFEDTYVQLVSDYEISILKNDSDLHNFETGREHIYLTAKGVDLVNTVLFRLESLNNQKNNLALFDGLKKPEKLSSPVVPEIVSPGNSNLQKLENLGFVSASKVPEEAANVFVLPNEIGGFLQKIQPHKALILIKGTKHTSKSQLAMQAANAFAENDMPVAYIDYEQGGLECKDTVDSVNRNTTEKGRKLIAIKGFLENPFEELKNFCEYVKVIVADSVTDLGISADQLNELRVGFPDVIWCFISQVKENGEMYGGNKMAHNPTMIIKCHKSEDPKLRYATLEKNRGNDLELIYSIYYKKMVESVEELEAMAYPKEPEPVAEPIAKPTYSGSGFAFQV